MEKQFVLDNGSYNIKAGYPNDLIKVRNVISKTRDGALHISNEYLKQNNNFSGITFKRPFEQGHLVSWETEKPIWDYLFDIANLDPSETQLTLTEAPYQLPQLSINTDLIVFEEYGFARYYRCTPASLAPWVQSSVSDFTLIIDAGYSTTWIVPVIYQKMHWKGVRKFPIGGMALSGLLRELISFRHYDITNEPILINSIKEQTCKVSSDFNQDIKKKLFSEFVLPDFKTTATGYVLPDKSKAPANSQTLKLRSERYVVGEAFFHPEVVFDSSTTTSALTLSIAMKNLTDLVVESIMACPEVIRPLILANLMVIGGTAMLPSFESRLVDELRRELPQDWNLSVTPTHHPKDEVAWIAGTNLASDEVMRKISISKSEYFEHGSNWCQTQFGFKNNI